jgi:hypothetical protein
MSPCVCSFFSMAVCTEIGDGSSTLFWKDRWLHGQSVQDLAPKIFCMVPKRIANKRTVQDAMQQGRWIQDIHGEATWAAMAEFLVLWDTVSDISPLQGISDKHMWRWSSSGSTQRNLHTTLRIGSIHFGPWKSIWKTWAPGKCRFFLWLAAHDRCWTADRLARRNLPHPEFCPLCDQEMETINHLLVSCVFVRQFWLLLLRRVGLGDLSPQPLETNFFDWWCTSSTWVNQSVRKGFNSLVTLGAWTLWRHRNECVFNGASPRLSAALAVAGEEAIMWSMAGAKELALLTGHGGDAVV